jgi:hypothetical protein
MKIVRLLRKNPRYTSGDNLNIAAIAKVREENSLAVIATGNINPLMSCGALTKRDE